MKRVLLVGNCPLPNENTSCRPAAGLRTHQFLNVLRGNCIVQLVTIAMPECYGDVIERTEIKHSDNFFEAMISKDDSGLRGFLQRVHDDFEPEIIVSVNTFPSYMVAGIKSQAPFWVDLNGWIMAEAQAQAYKIGSDDYLQHYYEMEKAIVQRADKISVVSRNQGQALLGELAAFGRLNSKTFDYNFVEHIPNGTEMFDSEKNAGDHAELFADVPEDAFVLAWIGGYNTWVDEETLYKGVAAAMKKCKKLYFVSTGGSVDGLDNITFKNFREMISKSDLEERFVFLGWVDTDQIPYIYRRADAGINVDRICTETLTGARNRINEMMKFGLPVITTLGSEIAEEVERVGAGLVVQSGNWKELGEAIVEMYKKHDLEKFGRNGEIYIEKECNYRVVMKPLISWIKDASAAPDRFRPVNFGKIGKVKSMWRYFQKNGFKKTFSKVLQGIGTFEK